MHGCLVPEAWGGAIFLEKLKPFEQPGVGWLPLVIEAPYVEPGQDKMCRPSVQQLGAVTGHGSPPRSHICSRLGCLRASSPGLR